MEVFEYIINLIESTTVVFFAYSLSSKKQKNHYLVSIVFVILCFLSISFLNLFLGYEGIYFFVDLALLFIYLSIISNDSFSKKLSFSTIPLVLISNISPMIVITISFIFYQKFDYISVLRYLYLPAVLLIQITFLLLAIYLSKLFKRVESYLSNRDYFFIFFAFLLIKIIFTSNETILYTNEPNTTLAILSIYCLVLFSILICFTFGRMSIRQQQLLKSKYELANMELQFKIYQKALKSQNELLTIRHDLKHVLSTINNKDDNLIFLNEIQSKYNNELDNLYIPINTSNTAINNAVNTKGSEAINKGIDFISNINFVSKINIPDDELFIILSNLLDNAIQHIGTIKLIRFTISELSGTLKVQVSNSVDPETSILPDLTLSQNSSYHGFGLKSVKAILERNNGDMLIDISNSQFIVTLFLLIDS